VSAVIARAVDIAALEQGLDRMNATLGKPPMTVLHWAANVKEHTQRKFVAREIAKLPCILTSVVVVKQPLMGSGTGLSDPAQMYNYAVRRLLERISWYVNERNGEVDITFAHIRRFPYWRLWSYLRLLRAIPTSIKWGAIPRGPGMDQPLRVRPLQLADLTAGAVGSAVRADSFGAHEHAYLDELIPRIYLRGQAHVDSYGVNVVGPPNYRAYMSQTYPWWDDFCEKCRRRPDRQ
jgi:hypothetical protein